MMTKVINSPAAEVPRKAKKAEGKKRKSPCTPYRKREGERKKKGKTDGVLVEQRRRSRKNWKLILALAAASE